MDVSLQVLQARFEVFFLKWTGSEHQLHTGLFFFSLPGAVESHSDHSAGSGIYCNIINPLGSVEETFLFRFPTFVCKKNKEKIKHGFFSPQPVCMEICFYTLYYHWMRARIIVRESESTLSEDKIMSSMFGKVKASNSADRCPAECNLVLLGAMGSGKSGLTLKLSLQHVCLTFSNFCYRFS